MRILSRYIIREILSYFFISLIAFTGFLFIVRVLKLSSLVINKGVAFFDVAQLFLAIIPTFLEIAVPLATLLGVMLAFARLSGDSELVVIRASGISLFQVLRPVLFVGLCSAAITLYVSVILKPWGFKTLSSTMSAIARSKTSAALEPGVFNRLGSITFYTETLDQQTGVFTHAVIEDRRSGRSLILASHGTIQSEAGDDALHLVLFDGSIHEQIKEDYVVTKFAENRISISADETGDEIVAKDPSPRELKNEEIALELAKPNLTPKRQLNLEIERWSRWSLPGASLVLAILALSLGVQPPRAQKTWGAALSLVLGMLVFVAYFALQSVGRIFADSGTLPAWLAAFVPTLTLIPFAIFLFYKVASEQWSSVADRLDRAFRWRRS